jgi:L-asparaginase II
MLTGMKQKWESLVEVIRGPLVESVHMGAIAIVNSQGQVLFQAGDIDELYYLRSSAKPFQTLPLLENGGTQHFGLTVKEIAITCASHQGTDDHVATLISMHEKIGLSVDKLLCGVHAPGDRETQYLMRERGEEPNAYHHNCSGKHTGMLAQCVLGGHSTEAYTDQKHPVQQQILSTFAEMVDVPKEDVVIGIDGCSAPVFAIPLKNAAFGVARLCDPVGLADRRQAACREATAAMMQHPIMVSGPYKSQDTLLMQAGGGKVISKGGADGYQIVGVLPGVIPGHPEGIGIAFKVLDGDAQSRARGVVVTTLMQTMGIMSEEELQPMKEFWRVRYTM